MVSFLYHYLMPKNPYPKIALIHAKVKKLVHVHSNQIIRVILKGRQMQEYIEI